MLDSYELKQGSFEIVDSQMVEIRSKRILYFRLIRFLLISLAVTSVTLISLIIITTDLIWFALLMFAAFFAVLAFRNLNRLTSQLTPQISGILLDYDQHKELQRFRVRRWMANKLDTYTEEEIRHNQAIGFRVRWFDSGYIEVEIIVDPEFPGTIIFQTFDFFVIAELFVFFAKAIPSHNTWVYVLEDDVPWDETNLVDLQDDIATARVPWNIREYFTQL